MKRNSKNINPVLLFKILNLIKKWIFLKFKALNYCIENRIVNFHSLNSFFTQIQQQFFRKKQSRFNSVKKLINIFYLYHLKTIFSKIKIL